MSQAVFVQEQAYLINFSFEDTHWWFVGRRQIILDRIRQAFPGGVSAKSVLDFGCGTGKLMQCMSDFETVIGIDASEISLEYCRKRGLKTVMKDEDFFRENRAQFNVVTLLDVLEHVPDEAAVLGRIHHMLTDDGLLLVTVPAYQFLWGDEDELSDHLRRYTAKGLKQVVTASGFEVTFISYFNFFLLPIISIVVLTKRLLARGQAPVSNVRPVPNLINQALIMVLALEAWLLRRLRLPVGASVILCAKKKTKRQE